MVKKSIKSSQAPKIQKKKIEKLVREFLIAINENPDREGLKDTPKRVSNFFEEFFKKNFNKPEEIVKVTYSTEKYEEIVLIKNLPFYSLCEHHILPFYGKANIAYIPAKNRLPGISKIGRLFDFYAKRLQLQERLTSQVADAIVKTIKPIGVIVTIDAEHLCLTMRGIKKTGSKIVTSAVRGIFLKDHKARAEALSLLAK